MVFDSLRERMGGTANVMPMKIAHQPLFTAKEKLELLHQLKSEAAAAAQDGKQTAFAPAEIDAAIAEVHRGVQSGVGTDTVVRGDF